MNKLIGKITKIESSQHMSMVDIDVAGDHFCAIVLETPQSAPYLKEGKDISFVFKETEVSIAKGLSGQISLRNRAVGHIRAIEASTLLSKIVLDYKGHRIVSIISTRSVKNMDLKVGEAIEWLVKTNEVSLLGEKS